MRSLLRTAAGSSAAQATALGSADDAWEAPDRLRKVVRCPVHGLRSWQRRHGGAVGCMLQSLWKIPLTGEEKHLDGALRQIMELIQRVTKQWGGRKIMSLKILIDLECSFTLVDDIYSYQSLLVYLTRRTVTDLLICVMEIPAGLSGHLRRVCLHTCLLTPKEDELSTNLEAVLQWNDTENDYNPHVQTVLRTLLPARTHQDAELPSVLSVVLTSNLKGQKAGGTWRQGKGSPSTLRVSRFTVVYFFELTPLKNIKMQTGECLHDETGSESVLRQGDTRVRKLTTGGRTHVPRTCPFHVESLCFPRRAKNPKKKLPLLPGLCIPRLTKLSGIPDLIIRQRHESIKVLTPAHPKCCRLQSHSPCKAHPSPVKPFLISQKEIIFQALSTYGVRLMTYHILPWVFAHTLEMQSWATRGAVVEFAWMPPLKRRIEGARDGKVSVDNLK
ncbi:hypothetical protein PANDA_000666 [Ailuropoda melanoleuca]|uniref:Uncharacterized protein n=1 Tax=Ailuropoda melanoleuca TaxID=9646 RepID=D2GVC4_AILME|nr:hypothetical protein PANDA_000666 [Ailuropoda melanoleuca]